MKRTGFAPRTQPMARGTSKLGNSSFKKTAKAIKSRGMKGIAPTVEEKSFHDALAGLGCICCRLDGNANPLVSIHHIDGRTKPGCHKLVLPLCAQHHQQDDSDSLNRIAVHPNKGRFEARYGTQRTLLAMCIELLKM